MDESLYSREVVENRLLVEGSDDENVCYHLLKLIGLEGRVEVVDKIRRVFAFDSA